MTTAALSQSCRPGGWLKAGGPRRRRAASSFPAHQLYIKCRRADVDPSAATATAAATAPPASALRPIQPQPSPLTAEGLVPCMATLDAVPADLRELLSAAVEACRAQLGCRLLGVFLRGSLVQQGCFVPGVSDADFLVLHLPLCKEDSEDINGSSREKCGEGTHAEQEGLRQAAERLQCSFGQCSKVELHCVELLPSCALHTWALLWRQQQDEHQQAAAAAGSAAAPQGSLPPSALHGQQALAFQLKTQAVCLWGWDLPALLPDVAALPPLQLLPELVKDVAAALQHCQQSLVAATAAGASAASAPAAAAGGLLSQAAELAAAARAVRWALKRCVRAAMELSLHSTACDASWSDGSSKASGTPSGTSSRSSMAGGTAALPTSQQHYWSRDLWWCVQSASCTYPELQQPLWDALRLYVALGAAASSNDGSSSGGSSSGGSSSKDDGSSNSVPQAQQARQQQEQAAAVEQGALAAAQLAAKLDALFLQQMLAEEPGWLMLHGNDSSRGNSGNGSSSENSASGGSGSGSRSSSGSPGWLQRLRVNLLAATAGGGMEANLMGVPPLAVAATVHGPVLTLDWQQPGSQQQAAAIIAAALAADGSSAGSSSASAEAVGRLLSGPPLPSQPVLLKGAAADWPAVQRWSLAFLARAGLQGRARLAPSLQFPFTEPRLATVLAQRHGVEALPSCVAGMGAAEFAARMQRDNPCGLQPLVYGGAAEAGVFSAGAGTACRAGTEYAYFQAELPPSLLADCRLSAPPFALPAGAPPEVQLRQTQAARVWVGPQGAVSPTHYDLSHSFLTQVRGRKRMLFWGPDELPYLYFYPDTHLLRRRSRVNMHAPQPGRFPLFERAQAAGAREALLEPGDVVFFPSRWAHYTESLDFSISVTCRFSGRP